MKAKELTPHEAWCGVDPCPAIFETDQKTYLVIGSIPGINEIPRNVRRKLGKGEIVIEVPRAVLPIK